MWASDVGEVRMRDVSMATEFGPAPVAGLVSEVVGSALQRRQRPPILGTGANLGTVETWSWDTEMKWTKKMRMGGSSCSGTG
jgi:hypothetical protein